MAEFFQNLNPLLYSLGIIIGAGIIGFVLHFIIFQILSRLHSTTSYALYGSLIKHTRRPVKYLILLLPYQVYLHLMKLLI